jgi:hypothetical protein
MSGLRSARLRPRASSAARSAAGPWRTDPTPTGRCDPCRDTKRQAPETTFDGAGRWRPLRPGTSSDGRGWSTARLGHGPRHDEDCIVAEVPRGSLW